MDEDDLKNSQSTRPNSSRVDILNPKSEPETCLPAAAHRAKEGHPNTETFILTLFEVNDRAAGILSGDGESRLTTIKGL